MAQRASAPAWTAAWAMRPTLGTLGASFDDDGDGLAGDGFLDVTGDGGGGVCVGGEGFAEAVLDVGAGDVDFEEVGICRCDFGGDFAELGCCSGEDAGDDGDAARLELGFGLPEQADFFFDAGVSQTDGIEEAAAPVDAGGVDVAVAGFGAAALGGYGAAAFVGGSYEQAYGRAPNAAREHEGRGQVTFEKRY